jgi:hypothetical protein
VLHHTSTSAPASTPPLPDRQHWLSQPQTPTA